MKNLKIERDIVFFDLETTGTDTKNDRKTVKFNLRGFIKDGYK